MRTATILTSLVLMIAASTGCAAPTGDEEVNGAAAAVSSPGDVADNGVLLENEDRLTEIKKVYPPKPSDLSEHGSPGWPSTGSYEVKYVEQLKKQYPTAKLRFFEWDADVHFFWGDLEIVQLDRPNMKPVVYFFLDNDGGTYIGSCTDDAAGKLTCLANPNY